MKRYLVPTKTEVKEKVYSNPAYIFSFGDIEYTIYADSRERAQRVFDELCKTGEIKLLKPNT